MLNPRNYANSRGDGFGVLEAIGEGAEGQSRRFVPLKRTELRGDVTGPLASLRSTQVFAYTARDCDHALEAAYRFPLPGDAAVLAVRVRFGGVTVRAKLADHRDAEAGYAKAVQEGRQAALATRESPDVFTLQVAGLRPDQEVTVETSFLQLARAEGAGWSLRIPLTTAPRFTREDESGSRFADAQPLSVLRDPGHRFALDLNFRGDGPVESPTHRLSTGREGGGRRVRLLDGEVVPDRDLLLHWQPEAAPDRPALAVVRHDDLASGFAYFLATVAPPAARDPGRGLAREVILLVDHSGSMEGPKWEAADWAVERFLADLKPQDRFALGLFHNTTRWFAGAPQAAEPEAIARAIAFLKANRESGGTELGVALEQAIGQARGQGELARHVLLVTDAEVTDVSRLLGLAERESRRADRRRISVLCIDAAPHSFLALELAERGGGVARFLTSDPKEQDIATALDRVLADWAEPVLAGLRLEVDRPGALGSGRASIDVGRAGWSGIDLGDLPAGRSPWVVGRVPLGEAGPLDFRLATAKGHEVASLVVEAVGETPDGPALKALYGARQLNGLDLLAAMARDSEQLRDRLGRLGYEPGAILDDLPTKVYPENAEAAFCERFRAFLVRESLAFGLPCAVTAFLAERAEAGQVVEARVEVASALPAGWSANLAPATVLRALGAHPASAGGLPLKLIPRSGRGGGYGGSMHGRGGGYGAPETVDSFLMHPMPAAMPAAPMAKGGEVPSLGSDRHQAVVFLDSVRTADGEAILYDSTKEANPAVVPDLATLNRVSIEFPDGVPDRQESFDGLILKLFVDDPTEPRAEVRVRDLVRQGGSRPLNLVKRSRQVVRIVLVDPAGTWKGGSPRMRLTLHW